MDARGRVLPAARRRRPRPHAGVGPAPPVGRRRAAASTSTSTASTFARAVGRRDGRGGSRRRCVLGFKFASRDEVDRVYADLTGAGYRGQQPPYDAFWGARYAVVEDPDGNAVGLMSPIDPALPTRRDAAVVATSRRRRYERRSLPGRCSSASATGCSSSRMTVPFTITCRMPTGLSATSRSPSAGKSRMRRSGPGRDAVVVEHHDVGRLADLDRAAVAEAEHAGRLAGELVDRVLERHDFLVAHPVAEQVGREARVAELAHVRAGVGEAEQHRVLREEPRDRFGIVVGEHAREARVEVLLERQVEHEVEGRAAALVGDRRRRCGPSARGAPSLSATSSESKFIGSARLPRAARELVPRAGAPRRDRGRRRCARRAGGPSAPGTPGRMLNVNGSRRFIWKVSGRHETCGQTSSPRRAPRCWPP